MAFAEPDELRRWPLRRSSPLTEDEEQTAAFLISLAQGVIEDAAGQPLESSTDTVVLDGPTDDDREYHVATRSRRLVLPRWPVTAVAEVRLTRDDEVLVHGADADYTWSQAGILTRCGEWWPAGDQVIEVTYTAGFTTLPPALKRICLRLAGQGWDNPEGLTSESLGDHSKTWAAETLGMELSAADERTIGAYQARTQS